MSTFAERDAIESMNAMLARRDKKIESLRTRIAALERCVKAADRMRLTIEAHYCPGCDVWHEESHHDSCACDLCGIRDKYDAARAEVDK